MTDGNPIEPILSAGLWAKGALVAMDSILCLVLLMKEFGEASAPKSTLDFDDLLLRLRRSKGASSSVFDTEADCSLR